MNQHSSSQQKYYHPLIGVALITASLFHFSLPVFAAGTEAGEVLRNTATGSYQDDAGNPYTIESNTVNVTVAKVAGLTNQPTGITDNNGGTVLTNDRVYFEFTITNVGNDVTDIFIPTLDEIATKGLDRTIGADSSAIETDLVLQVSPALTDTGTHTFDTLTNGTDPSDLRPGGTNGTGATDGIVKNVPINGKVIVRVTGSVSATAAGAPIEVLLGDTGTNTDPNSPVATTQNQPDADDGAAAADQAKDVRTTTADNGSGQVDGDPTDGQKEASALQQVFLGSNPLAMTRIEKTRVEPIDQGANATNLDDNIITYNLELEVLSTTPNALYTPGNLEGRDFDGRITGIADPNDSNLVLISDAIPAGTALNAAIAPVGDWTPVYTTETDNTIRPDAVQWTTTPPTLTDVTRVGWVYDARAAADGPIARGTTVLTADGGFTFNVITSGLNATTGGTVANIAQVFGSTDDGDPATITGVEIFDESGDQNPANFNDDGSLGPNEDDSLSTGIADPAAHGVDNENNNNTNGTEPPSPGGEDNVITIGAPGDLINGPDGQPAATGNVFGQGPDNDHDFQNLGVSNFPVDVNGNPTLQHNNAANPSFDPASVTFNNTLSNPGTTDLSDVLLQPIQPSFDGLGGTDANLPPGTKVTINLGTQQAIYTYTDNGGGNFSFVLDANDPTDPALASQAIGIPVLAAGVPLDYAVTVDLPSGTGLSTDDAVNHGYPVPIIAFVDGDDDGTPDTGENRNFTVNQVYTGFIKVSKQVRVLQPDGSPRLGPGATPAEQSMDFDAPDSQKQPLPGDILEYRVIYRNISEPQVGTGNNGILNGINVMIDENGTLGDVTAATDGNNWALDNNTDGDLDTINVQNTASDSNNGTITFYTGATDTASTDTYSVDTLTSAGTTDPGVTVTGYRVIIPRVSPAGSEDLATTPALANSVDAGDNTFTFRRTVDEFDGLAQEGLD